MLLTITTTHNPATDLGFLLHKHPERFQTFSLPFGEASVFYPEANEDRCTIAVLLAIDPIGLVRKSSGSSGFALDQYVNDRPYVTSSFTSVAIGEVFKSALSGTCNARPDLARQPMFLEVGIPVLSSQGGTELVEALFTPLGYEINAHPLLLDEHVPEWGAGNVLQLKLTITATLQSVLTHLYVLLPVLDNQKHYWVGEDEIEKLLRRGEGWLQSHPNRELIVRRYLRHRRHLTDPAMSRLAALDETASDDPTDAEIEDTAQLHLHDLRIDAAAKALADSGARRVLDLGCGEGRLIERLIENPQFVLITGMDVSHRSLEIARRRLATNRNGDLPDRVGLLHGSLTYRDARLQGYDGAAVVEVIEHLDPHRLHTFERLLFEFAHPARVVVTTPNREYNAIFERMHDPSLRHRDHRFEWTRAEFRAWADNVAQQFGYAVQVSGIGEEDHRYGSPSQIALFDRRLR